ncbi:hypothetical protein TcWFU_004720 [Taenia crassiceps]|uniref:Uncharacterized protein n=1 Tax=Taenia crassiceps TaxID=6207 RepID=A0ABR4QLL2_9CEST
MPSLALTAISSSSSRGSLSDTAVAPQWHRVLPQLWLISRVMPEGRSSQSHRSHRSHRSGSPRIRSIHLLENTLIHVLRSDEVTHYGGMTANSHIIYLLWLSTQCTPVPRSGEVKAETETESEEDEEEEEEEEEEERGKNLAELSDPYCDFF